MTWDINNFASLSRYHEGGTVTFGDDSKEKIVGIGNIKLGLSPMIENVTLVDGLKHNLLSVSQLCDKGFDNLACRVIDRQSNTCIFSGFRENNVYMIDMSICFAMLLV